MKENWSSRKGAKVLKINSLCVCVALSVGLFPWGAISKLSLPLFYFSSAFIWMPQWNWATPVHAERPLSCTAVPSSAIAFNQLVALSYYFLLPFGVLLHCPCSNKFKRPILLHGCLGEMTRKQNSLLPELRLLWTSCRFVRTWFLQVTWVISCSSRVSGRAREGGAVLMWLVSTFMSADAWIVQNATSPIQALTIRFWFKHLKKM